MNRVRVLFLGSSFGLGLTYHLTDLASALARAGIAPTVISDVGEDVPGLLRRLEHEGVPVHVVPGLDNRSPLRALRQRPELRAFLRDADVAHAQGFIQLLKLAAAGVPGRRPAYVASIHGYRHGTDRESSTARLGVRVLNRIADQALPMSAQSAEDLIRYGLDPRITTPVPLGVDIARFRPAPDDAEKLAAEELAVADPWKTILYPANMVPRKGHRYLLKGFAAIQDRHPSATLILLGGGPGLEATRAMARSIGVSDRVIIPGRVSRPVLLALHRTVRIACVPSLSETFCHAIVEPMAAGMAVVSTPVGIAPEILRDGRAGVLVPKQDGAALARALDSLLADPSLTRRMGEQGRRIIQEQFTWDVVSRRFAAAYACAMDARDGSRPQGPPGPPAGTPTVGRQ